MNKSLTILGISGSLRTNSYNMAVLKQAAKRAPANTKFKIFENLADIPLFNQEFESAPPIAVVEFKQQIESADAILFATPEYNHGVPGVLKNAIDWASRPYGQNSWEGKPVGIMSASISMLGGARAQEQLRQVFAVLNMHPLNRPEVIIPNAYEKVDAKGNITDEHTKEKVREMVDALIMWTKQLKAGEKAVQENEGYEYFHRRMTS